MTPVRPMYIVALGLVLGIAWTTGALEQMLSPIGPAGTIASPFAATAPRVTLAKYNALRTGMTHSDAVAAMGFDPVEQSRTEVLGITSVTYAWANADGTNAVAIFQDGSLISKGQLGLR